MIRSASEKVVAGIRESTGMPSFTTFLSKAPSSSTFTGMASEACRPASSGYCWRR